MASLPAAEAARARTRVSDLVATLADSFDEAAVVAARLTGVVTPEQIRRLAENKAFAITAAASDFNFAPRSFAAGVKLEAESLGLARSTQRR